MRTALQQGDDSALEELLKIAKKVRDALGS